MNIEKSRNGGVTVYHVDLNEATENATSCVVVESVAELTDQDTEDLDPLLDSVDPEALDSFVTHARTASASYELAFRYQNYTVEVVSDDRLRLVRTDETRSAASA